MSSFSGSIPKKKTSFLIKDILSDDAGEKDEYHHSFHATSRFYKPIRNSDVHCRERRLPFHRNESSPCSCHQPGAFLGCTVPLSVRIPSPKLPCGCQVSTPRGRRWPHEFLCCQPPRPNRSPQHLSPLPPGRFPSPHQIKQDEVVNEKKQTKRNLSDSSMLSRPTEQGMSKLYSHLEHVQCFSHSNRI